MNARQKVAGKTELLSKALYKRLMEPDERKCVLHLFSGPEGARKLPQAFADTSKWEEIRQDPFANNKPDIIGGLPELAQLPGECLDAIWLSHGLQRVSALELPGLLRTCMRILRWKGFLLATTPDLMDIVRLLWEGKSPMEMLFKTPHGPIHAIDMLYGAERPGNLLPEAMRHRNAFSAVTLGTALKEAGFANVEVKRIDMTLWGLAHKLPADAPGRHDKIMVLDKNAPPMTKGASGLSDELDAPPHLWKPLGLKQ